MEETKSLNINYKIFKKPLSPVDPVIDFAGFIKKMFVKCKKVTLKQIFFGMSMMILNATGDNLIESFKL